MKKASTVHGINHRGYSKAAPENTLAAYRLSIEKGFTYVECDVSFTADNKAVLLHDETVDRTSNGTGKISKLTFDEVRRLDFGSWFSEQYAGEKIPTFEEFISLCSNAGLTPYIELKKGCSQQGAEELIDMVDHYGMLDRVSWISFSKEALVFVKNRVENARLGFIVERLSKAAINTAKALRTEQNEVFIDARYTSLTPQKIALCQEAGIPLEVWTVNTKEALMALDPYVTGVTSDWMRADFEV